MTQPLTDQFSVEAALLRPLTTVEAQYIDQLVDQASALLRTAVPAIDTRIAKWVANPNDLTGVSTATVSACVAGVIKRYIANPLGRASEGNTTGPFGHTVSYALRGEKERRGTLEITSDDIAVLFPSRKRPRAGTFRLRPTLAPRPVGRYGPLPTPGEALAAAITFDSDETSLISEQPIVIVPGDGGINQ